MTLFIYFIVSQPKSVFEDAKIHWSSPQDLWQISTYYTTVCIEVSTSTYHRNLRRNDLSQVFKHVGYFNEKEMESKTILRSFVFRNFSFWFSLWLWDKVGFRRVGGFFEATQYFISYGFQNCDDLVKIRWCIKYLRQLRHFRFLLLLVLAILKLM